jgi:hypothetical protein
MVMLMDILDRTLHISQGAACSHVGSMVPHVVAAGDSDSCSLGSTPGSLNTANINGYQGTGISRQQVARKCQVSAKGKR